MFSFGVYLARRASMDQVKPKQIERWLKRIRLNKVKGVVWLRLNIYANNLCEAGAAIAFCRTACPAEQIKKS